MVKIQRLEKKFGKNRVLSGVDLEISKSGIFSILGPNGSGKTTLIKSILGLVIPDNGSISVFGKNIIKGPAYRRHIDYLPQIANFPNNLKVKELVQMIKDLRGCRADDMHYVEYFKLTSFLNQSLGSLSGGTKQKVNIALCFMFDSPLLILDEPTTGLDPISLIRLKDLIKKAKSKGKTILISSHIMRFVEDVSDEIVFLLDGKVYFKGSISDLKSKTNQQDFEHAIATVFSENHV